MENKLPSQFQPGETALIDLTDGKTFYGEITKVSFTKSKVLYDVELEIVVPGLQKEDGSTIHHTRLHSIDSAFVKKYAPYVKEETM